MTKAAIDAGLMPAELWSMPVSHVRFMFYEEPQDDEPAGEDLITAVAKKNAGKIKPFIPMWMMPHNRGMPCR